MNQISGKVDEELNQLSRQIGKAEGEILSATTEKDTAWDEVFNYFNEVGSDYFIADDGYILSKQKRQGSPKLNEDVLRTRLEELYPRQFDVIWNRITERKVSALKLEQAVQEGLVPNELLQEAITEPEPIYARVRREWSKQDTERARVFGVEKK